jgi:hypothetical protein
MPRSFLVNATDLTVLGAVGSTGTTITCAAGEGAFFPAPPFYAVIEPFNASTREYIFVQAVNVGLDQMLNVVRQIEGETPQTIEDGSNIRIAYVAQILDDLWDEIETKVNRDGDTMTGALILPGVDPTVDNEASRKAFVDAQVRLAQSLFRYETDTGDANPGAGQYRRNTLDPTATTQIFMNDSDLSGMDISSFLLGLDSGDVLVFRGYDGNTEAYDVTGPAIDATTYVKVPVTFRDQNGTIGNNIDAAVNALASQVHNHDALYLALTGGTLSGELLMGTNRIRNVGDAVAAADALNRTTGDARYAGIAHAADHESGGGDQISHDSMAGVSADDHHPQIHNVGTHGDTTATGAELNTLTDGSDASALHTHAGNYESTRATMTAAQNIPTSGAAHNVLFDTEAFDDGNRHVVAPSTPQDRITLPAGDWQLHAQIVFDTDATGKREVEIWDQNDNIIAKGAFDASATGETNVNIITGPYRIATTRWFRVKAFQTSGGALAMVPAGCFFTATRLD